jgi:hypothetical protein
MSFRAVRAVVCASALALGCAKPAEQKPLLFGGQGARIASPDEKPLPAADSARDAGPCGRESPASDTALLDDFEDGDGKIFKGFEREGYWFTTSDKTEGALAKPIGNFAAELLPPKESTPENRYAAHLSASGQKDWGVLWGTTLAWVRKGIRCPVNLSSFAGLRFRAKGPGTIRVALSVPEVQAKEYGGLCLERCYDAHGRVFTLSDRWETYTLRWDRMEQEGWGAEARFTPSRLVSFMFKVAVKNLPIDFWVDDIELVKDAAR